MKALFPTLHVSNGWRSAADQEQAFKEGKTKLHFPHSAHNAMLPDGRPQSRAVDLFSLTEDGIAVFPPLLYAKIWEKVQERRDPIRWGGTFKTLGDMNHFELA